ncbi:MAG: DUF5615 family PIN-like protein [Dehalococcoidia bacterium]
MSGFLIDEDLSLLTAFALRDAGYASIHVRNVGLQGQTDRAIFNYAREHDYIVVTADRGFSDVLTFQPNAHAGIIVIRVPSGFSMRALNALLLNSLANLSYSDLRNSLVIVEPGRVRIRRAPSVR